MVLSSPPPLEPSSRYRRARGTKRILPHPGPRRLMRRALKSIAEMSDAEWERAFPNEETCIEWLAVSRWPQRVCCPRCGSSLVFPASLQEYRWRCFSCVPDLGHPFDVRSGTIFEDSTFPLRLWLKALHQELIGRGPGSDAREENLRGSIRDALRANEFRRMVWEPSLVPSLMRDRLPPRCFVYRSRKSCPKPTPHTVLPP
jgi:Transposase zinc-ribbon domain